MCKPTHGAIRLELKTFRVTRTRQKGRKVTAFRVYRHTSTVLRYNTVVNTISRGGHRTQ